MAHTGWVECVDGVGGWVGRVDGWLVELVGGRLRMGLRMGLLAEAPWSDAGCGRQARRGPGLLGLERGGWRSGTAPWMRLRTRASGLRAECRERAFRSAAHSALQSRRARWAQGSCAHGSRGRALAQALQAHPGPGRPDAGPMAAVAWVPRAAEPDGGIPRSCQPSQQSPKGHCLQAPANDPHLPDGGIPRSPGPIPP
jgi:hypothetical protein